MDIPRLWMESEFWKNANFDRMSCIVKKMHFHTTESN